MLGKNFIFIHIPKAAGSSIQHYLKEYSEDKIHEINGQEGDWINSRTGILENFELKNRFGSKHAKIEDYYNNWDEDIYGDINSYFKFCVIRNPWDRMFSFYNYNNLFDLIAKHPFDKEKFIKQCNYDSSMSFCKHEGKMKMNYYIRYDNLQDDFDVVCESIGIPKTKLLKLNSTKQPNYRMFYDIEMLEYVEEMYKEEIDYFDLSF